MSAFEELRAEYNVIMDKMVHHDSQIKRVDRELEELGERMKEAEQSNDGVIPAAMQRRDLQLRQERERHRILFHEQVERLGDISKRLVARW